MDRMQAGISLAQGRLAGVTVEVILASLICLGLGFRFQWLDWSQGASLHPDEYGLANTLSQLSIPRSPGEYFNTRISPLSPYQKYDLEGRPATPGADNRMRWGQWPITLFRWVVEKTGSTGYGDLIRTGRRLSALADSLTLLFLFLIGRLLHNRRTALLATALSALSVMQIQQSHFMTVDTLAVLFATAAMYCAVRAIRRFQEDLSRASMPILDERSSSRLWFGEWRWFALFGLTAGMAIASRINLAPLLAMAPIAAVVAGSREWHQRAGKRPMIAVRAVLHVSLAVLVASVTFRATYPTAFRAETGETSCFTLRLNPDWIDSMKVAAAESNLEGGGPPAEQWTGRRRLLFPLLNMIFWGMGLPFGFAACAGFAWSMKRVVRDDDWRTHLLVITWVGGYFLFMGTRRVMSMRYFLPIYPFLSLLAAWALIELWKKSRARSPVATVAIRPFGSLLRAPSLAVGSLISAVILGTLAWSWSFTTIYRNPNTRIEASRWMLENIPGALDLHLITPDGPHREHLLAHEAKVDLETPLRIPFRVRQKSTLESVCIRTTCGEPAPVLHVVLAGDPKGEHPVAQADVHLKPSDSNAFVGPAVLGPVTLEPGREYHVVITAVRGGTVKLLGASIANESWDESLPLPLDGRDPLGGIYRGLTMEVRWPDNDAKRRMLIENVAASDYIVLPSQRALWSIPRLPDNYPMTMEYYRALFDGRLGFELAAQFHRPFRIGPLQFSDLTGRAALGSPVAAPGSAGRPFDQGPLAAEEAFSVYDHAPVWVFRRVPAFSVERARAILEAFDLGNVTVQSPREATVAPTGLMLPRERLMEQRAGGTWSQVFHRDGILNRHPILAVVSWYGTVLFAGLLAFPLTYLALGSLPDRGYPLAKIVGMLAVAWAGWILASFRALPFTRPTIILCILFLGVSSLLVLHLRRRELVDYVRRNIRHLVLVELLFLALFLFDLIIRLCNPDLWHPSFGGEKPMVLSYFHAVLKSTSFPPYDPWLAGGVMNYYYFGLVAAGQLVKLLGVVPSVAYNLVLPTWFALVGTGAFSIAYNLVACNAKGDASGTRSHAKNESLGSSGTRDQRSPGSAGSAKRFNPYLAGIASLLLVVLLGNLAQVRILASAFQRASGRPAESGSDLSLPGVLEGAARVLSGKEGLPLSLGNWYWDASRVIAVFTGGNEINEFPFFTFLYADMHAHLLDMPVFLLVLAWALALAMSVRRRRSVGEGMLFWLVGGLALGATRVTNTWDFPTCLALCGMAIILQSWWQERRGLRARIASSSWKVMLLTGLAFLLYQPFDRWFASPVSTVELWRGAKTPLAPYVYCHGLFLFVLVTFLARETIRWLAETPASILSGARRWLAPVLLGLGAFCVCIGLMWSCQVSVALIAMPVIAWSGLLILRSRERLTIERRIVISLLASAVALTLFVELFAVGGDRTNTLFKLYLQAWLLLGTAAGPALAWIWRDRKLWNPVPRRMWTGGLLLLAAGATLYPATATIAKVRDRFPSPAISNSTAASAECKPIPGMPIQDPECRSPASEGQPCGLDGAAFMKWSAYCDRGWYLPLRYDHDAIRWMQDHVPGSPVIAEAQSFDLYRMSSRYAWFTGLPDVVGWDWHQRQQRAATRAQFVTGRGNEITGFYTSPAIDRALAFLRKHDVRYVIVGPLERAYYKPSGGLEKFETMRRDGILTVAYRNPGVTVYQVSAAGSNR